VTGRRGENKEKERKGKVLGRREWNGKGRKGEHESGVGLRTHKSFHKSAPGLCSLVNTSTSVTKLEHTYAMYSISEEY